jgi:hypothetical protein
MWYAPLRAGLIYFRYEVWHDIVMSPGDAPLSLPVVVPSLTDIIQFAKALHAAGQLWEGTAFGWPADDTPEIKEENAVFEESNYERQTL